MDESRDRRVEEAEEMQGNFGDQEESAQNTKGQVVVIRTVFLLAETPNLYEVKKGEHETRTMSSKLWALCMVGSWPWRIEFHPGHC